MKIQVTNGEKVAKRMFWLAWKACRYPLGAGVFQDNPEASEEDVWNNVLTEGDYPGPAHRNHPGYLLADYVFGRSMKLFIQYGEDWVQVPDATPDSYTEDWAPVYKTYEDLVKKAIESLEEENEI